MLNLNHSMEPDFYQYEDYLNEGLEVYVNPSLVNKKLQILIAQRIAYLRNITEYMWTHSGGKITYYDKEQFLDFLEFHCSVNSYFLKDRRTGRRSVNKENVIKPIRDKYEWLVDFLDMYIRFTEISSDISKLNKIANEFAKETTYIARSGEPLKAISFTYEQRDTGRYYTRNDGIQNYSKRYTDILTAPKDYFLYWADFHQIDLRVAYQTILSSDDSKLNEIFQTTEDKYEAMARIIDTQLGNEFDLENFQKRRDDYKVGVLARTYGQSAAQIGRDLGDARFAGMLNKYFVDNKKYSTYLQHLYDTVKNASVFTTYDYFGVERNLVVQSDTSRTINQALNTPIQSTSNSIVVHYTNAVVAKFRELGFGPDKFRLYLNRHDEVVFQMHNDCKPYLYILEGMSNVQVDDWAQLTMEHHLGYNYGVEDERLMEEFYQNITAHSHLAEQPKKSKPREDYVPVKPVIQYLIEFQGDRLIAVKENIDATIEIVYNQPVYGSPQVDEEFMQIEKDFTQFIIKDNKDICQSFNFQTTYFSDAQYLAEYDAYVNWDTNKTGDYYKMKRRLQDMFKEESEIQMTGG